MSVVGAQQADVFARGDAQVDVAENLTFVEHLAQATGGDGRRRVGRLLHGCGARL
jgi:hypothetical protein